MYDTLFSPQWIFDRCVEGEFLFVTLSITVWLCAVLLSFLLFKRLIFSKKLLIVCTFVQAIALVPLVFVISFLFGYAILNCSDSLFWQGVMPANELFEKVKHECKNDSCPKSEKELAQLDQPLYRQLINNAKSKYSYDPVNNRYEWYVRPSYYYAVRFEGNGFRVFRIPQFVAVDHWELPKFKGSEINLPR